ncbi:hypothetical protein [Rummeliibacillus suwonensis]|uniref:hypothetical protein n=1 Tax=Rummeliibacillus suwonensis TaxID=1306154 RepID=UPI001AAF40DE|nr:hypothetical protein [Rummeliibacillus suwonensis]MBO2536799.1 hypothetical protein [Rummeliibacillus suwonensis]
MKKGLLFSFLLAGSFLLYDNDAFAAESGNSTDQTLRPTENIIYFNSDKQDILATKESEQVGAEINDSPYFYGLNGIINTPAKFIINIPSISMPAVINKFLCHSIKLNNL